MKGALPQKVSEGVRGSSISSSNTCSNLCCFLQEFGRGGGRGGMQCSTRTEMPYQIYDTYCKGRTIIFLTGGYHFSKAWTQFFFKF